MGLGASDELVEADFEEVGELDESVQAGEGSSCLPAIVDAGAGVEELGEACLGEAAGFCEEGEKDEEGTTRFSRLPPLESSD